MLVSNTELYSNIFKHEAIRTGGVSDKTYNYFKKTWRRSMSAGSGLRGQDEFLGVQLLVILFSRNLQGEQIYIECNLIRWVTKLTNLYNQYV